MSSLRILGTDDQYLLGPLSNDGTLTRSGRAVLEVPTQQYGGRLLTQGGRTRWDDYVDAGGATGVLLPPGLRGLSLLHNLPLDAPPMALTDWASQPTEFGVCTPEEFTNLYTGQTVTCLHAFINTADHATDITSTFLLPKGPCFGMLFKRGAGSPPGMAFANQSWSLTFGGNLKLTWYRNKSAELRRDNVVIARRARDEGANLAYTVAPVMLFTIYNLLGRLYIGCTGWQGAPWVVENIGVLPAATVRLQGAGGWYAANVARLRYSSTGQVETDRLELLGEFPEYPYDPDTAPDGLRYTVYPTPPAGTAAAVIAVPGSTDGTGMRYRLTLTGDGTKTPVVQSWQVRYDPLFAAPTDTWWDITPWVLESRESRQYAMGPATLDLTLNPTAKNADGQTLVEYLGFEPAGDYSLRFIAGTRYADGTSYQPRFRGRVKAEAATSPVGAGARWTWQAIDGWGELDHELVGPPCVGAQSLVQAVKDIIAWGGTDPTTVLLADPTLDTLQLNDPSNVWETPVDDWSTPPYYPPTGTKPAGFLRETILTPAGVRLEYDGEGRPWLLRGYHPLAPISVALTLSAIPGASVEQGVNAVNMTTARQNLINLLLTEGMAPTGRPIYGMQWDSDSMNTPDTTPYVGRVQLRYVRLPDIATPERLAAATANLYYARDAGYQGVEVGARESDLWTLFPGTWITLEFMTQEWELATEDLLITKMSVVSSPVKRTVQVETEARPHG